MQKSSDHKAAGDQIPPNCGILYIVHLQPIEVQANLTRRMANKLLMWISPPASRVNILSELEKSVLSVRANMPEIPIIVVTDQTSMKQLDKLRLPNVHYKSIRETGGFSWADKINGLAYSPYEYTLFLDTDTYVWKSLTGIFQLLEYFDVAVAHDPVREFGYNFGSVPDSFPQFNTGVIGFKRSTGWFELLELWRQLHTQMLSSIDKPNTLFNDQNSFRLAAFRSTGTRIATLTPEYNYRPAWPGFVSGTVYIVHFRGNLKKLAQRLNRNNCKPRIFKTNQLTDLRYRLWVSIKIALSRFDRFLSR